MTVPRPLRIDFGSLARVGAHARGIAITLFVKRAVPVPLAVVALVDDTRFRHEARA